MLTFKFSGADGVMTVTETLTSGMVGKQVKFEFTTDWDNLTKTAVFEAGDISEAVYNVGNTVDIPAAVLEIARRRLKIGIYGEDTKGNITPTIYAIGPRIEEGADPYRASGDPPMPKWKELEKRIEDLENGTTGGGSGSDSGQNPTVGAGLHVGPDAPTDNSVMYWLDTDEEPEEEETLSVDTSLTIAGAAADAKATGEALKKLEVKIPTGGGNGDNASGGINVTGATVGQIIQIAEVDANGVPTAWTPVDMPSGAADNWEEVLNTTLEEAKTELRIDVGEGKTLKKLRAFISTGKNGLSAASKVALMACDDDKFNSNNDYLCVTAATVNTWAYPVFMVEYGNGAFPLCFSSIGSIDGRSVSNVVMGGISANHVNNPGPWRYFRIAPETADVTFNIGVTIKVWGVYA